MPKRTKKLCPRCHIEKPASEFVPNRSRPDGLSGYCRSCMQDQHRDFYAKNQPERLKQVTDRREALRLEHTKEIVEYLKTHPCESCGTSDVRVLEFFHGDEQIDLVRRYVDTGYSLARVMEAIMASTVLCQNCCRLRKMAMGEPIKAWTLDPPEGTEGRTLVALKA